MNDGIGWMVGEERKWKGREWNGHRYIEYVVSSIDG